MNIKAGEVLYPGLPSVGNKLRVFNAVSRTCFMSFRQN